MKTSPTIPTPRHQGARRRPPRIVARLAALAVLVAFFAGGVPLPAQEAGADEPVADNPIEARKRLGVIESLEEQGELIRRVATEVVREYRRLAIDRSAALQELGELESQLDRLVTRVRELSSSQLEAISRQVTDARHRYEALCDRASEHLQMLSAMVRQQEALDQRIAELRANLPYQEAALTGEWEVVWFPSELRGTFYLDQSGTLVTGQYRLGPRRTGSLRGTFVGAKIRLERVDAERGRDAELEGYLSSDGGRIEGTWQAYEMVQGGLPHGTWVAQRVD